MTVPITLGRQTENERNQQKADRRFFFRGQDEDFAPRGLLRIACAILGSRGLHGGDPLLLSARSVACRAVSIEFAIVLLLALVIEIMADFNRA